jgi:hypothetical protein
MSILLFFWSIAIFSLRFRHELSARRHLWSEPGFLACVSVVFTFSWKLLCFGFLLATEFVRTGPAEYVQHFKAETFGQIAFMELRPGANVGGAVLLAWLVIWASGRCRPRPTWLDWAGRLLGVAWVCLSLLAASDVMQG